MSDIEIAFDNLLRFMREVIDGCIFEKGRDENGREYWERRGIKYFSREKARDSLYWNQKKKST